MLNKSIYVGFTTLDLSKWMIFITILIKKIDAKLLITDTGSLIYEIKSEDICKEFFKWKDLFDFSSYLKNSEFFDSANKKVIAK